MKLVALVEVHPLSGAESFITARMSTGLEEFDMPLTSEQAELILRHSSVSAQQPSMDEFAYEDDSVEEYDFTPSPVVPKSAQDGDTMVIPGHPAGAWQTDEEYSDDDL